MHNVENMTLNVFLWNENIKSDIYSMAGIYGSKEISNVGIRPEDVQ